MQPHPTPTACLAPVMEALNSANSTRDRDERATALAIAREKARDCLQLHADSAEVNYIAGLVMYHSFCIEEKYEEQAKGYLEKAIDLNPQHQFARLYLGHLFYDTEAYERALACFETVKEDDFISMSQLWRVLKIHELTLCCKIYLNDPDVTTRSFELLAQEYLGAEEEDVPIPGELVTTLARTKGYVLWERVDRNYVRELVIDMAKKLSFYKVLENDILTI